MACQPQSGRAGRGGGGRGGRGGKLPKQNKPGALPRKGGEVGACKDLQGNKFTIESGNKGKDGDVYVPSRKNWHYILLPPMEMMHVRSGSWKSNWCCRSPLILIQY
jgi:hypothetical protein